MAEEKENEKEQVIDDDEVMLTEEDLDERREFMDEVIKDLSSINHKEVEIKSTSFPGHARSYKVEAIEQVYVPGKRGFVAAIRLIGSDPETGEETPELYQPTFRYPNDSVKISKKDGYTTLTLIYSHDPSVLHSFNSFYKKSRSDMKITIKYPEN